MKKYLELILSIVLMALIFINCWYSDQILDNNFLVFLGVNCILLVWYFICLILSFRNIKKERNFINAINLILLFLTALVVLFFPFRDMKVKLEFELFKDNRNKVIQLVVDDKLKENDFHLIELPNKYKKLSTSGEVHVYQNDEEGLVIGFYVFRGMLSGSVEVVYTSDDKLLSNNVGPVIRKEKLDNNWYYVWT